MPRIYRLLFITLTISCFFAITDEATNALGDEVRNMCQEAQNLINSRNFSRAISLLKKAEQIEPEAAEVHGYLGMAYQNSLKTQRAIPEYLRALELNPSMSFIKVNLGTCYMNLNQIDKAVPIFEQYLNENPNAPERAQVEAYLRQSGNRQSQNSLRGTMEEGQSQLNSGRLNDAIKTFEKVVANKPNWPPGHFYLGYALGKAGFHQRAIAEFQQSLKLDPGQKESLINIASNYQSLGEINSAILWYRRYLNEEPGSPKARDIQGRIKALEEEARKNGSGRTAQIPQYKSQVGQGFNPTITSNQRPGNGGYGIIPGASSLPQAKEDNYLSRVTSSGQFFRWPPYSMPIKVFIGDGIGLRGYRPDFKNILAQAFSKWSLASMNKIVFTEVLDKRLANIACGWTDNPNQIMQGGKLVEGGLTKISAQPSAQGQGVNITRAEVIILTIPRGDSNALSNDDLMKVCLHEVGHAIGINGHSNNNKDIMFYSESPSIWPSLTKRDKTTIRLLYAGHP